jgi:hypothetical protein
MLVLFYETHLMLKKSVCAQSASGAALHLPGPQVRHLPGPSHPAGPPHRQEHGGLGQLSSSTGPASSSPLSSAKNSSVLGSYVDVPNSY